jgi:aspartyl-tRNA(Asn)/glutamyl-tRNA(Gln) amidotransferase subunit A
MLDLFESQPDNRAIMELVHLTLSEASDLVSSRKISSLELTQAYISRIERLDPRLNTFITRTFEAALARARNLDQGDPTGSPLFGIPFALKDLYQTRGVRTTAGSKFFRDFIPEHDCVVIEKLNAAGAVILGKLNLHEIALGVTNDNPHFGAVRNPWDTACLPGGSSGGSGAALAADLCAASLGTDTGGSIRIPSSLCGVVGLKPTYGRVSVRGIIPLSWNLDHAGPMARRVRDAALIMQSIAGYDPDDPYSSNVPTNDYVAQLQNGVRGWRVAFASRGHFAQADGEVLEAVRSAAKVLEQLGARVDEIEIENAEEWWRTNGTMTTSDGAAYHHERLRDQPEDFGVDVRTRLTNGSRVSSTEYALARRTQTLARHWAGKFFDTYDILLTPTTPSVASKLNSTDAVETAKLLTRFTAPFNLTGLPALSLPCGFTGSGLPIGLQIVSRHWGEAKVLQAGFAFEQATEWHKKKPALD